MLKYKKWVAVFDNHGDCVDRNAEKVTFEFIKHFKPEIRIHGGDAFDFRALRRKATDEEKQSGIEEDYNEGMSYLQRLNPQVFLRGNHDERLYDAANFGTNGVLRDLCGKLADEIKTKLSHVEILPYDKRKGVYALGNLKVIHGYNTGITAARQAAMAYGSVIMGHVHANDFFSVPSLEPRRGWAIGCQCRLDMDYNRGQLNTLRQSHGFAYGLVYPSGSFRLWQAEEIGGQWVFPSEFYSLGGK